MPNTYDVALDHDIPADIAAALQDYPPAIRACLLDLRGLVLAAAADTVAVGPLVETLKWGQPSFLPGKPRVGSTVRLGISKSQPGACAMFFHCQTRLIETFRQLYPDPFVFEGNRAMIVPPGVPLPEEEIRHCVSLALTYHQWK